MSLALRDVITRDVAMLALWNAGAGVACFTTAKLALVLGTIDGSQVVALWPPSGIALACLLVHGLRCWPGVAAGAFLANLALGPTIAAAVTLTIGGTLAPVAAWLLLRKVGFRIELDRLRDAIALVFLGSKAAMLVSATIGALTLLASGAVAGNAFWGAWLAWWFADAMSVVVLTPPLLVLAQVIGRRVRAGPARWLEAAGPPAATILVMAIVAMSTMPMFFLVFPVIVWAALRFQLMGATPCALIAAMASSAAAVNGTGPFTGLDLFGTLITLHAFNASVALTALLLSVVVIQRRRATRAVERAVDQLSDAVASLEPYRLLGGGALDGILRTRDPKDH